MRARIPGLVLAALTVACGLLVRSRAAGLPGWFSKPAGDALYAVMVFWLARACAPRTAGRWLALSTWLICAAIEFLKLCDWSSLVAARASPYGRLVLGVGFHTENLLWYALGALASWSVNPKPSAAPESSGD